MTMLPRNVDTISPSNRDRDQPGPETGSDLLATISSFFQKARGMRRRLFVQGMHVVCHFYVFLLDRRACVMMCGLVSIVQISSLQTNLDRGQFYM